jgi:type VI secretion system protein
MMQTRSNRKTKIAGVALSLLLTGCQSMSVFQKKEDAKTPCITAIDISLDSDANQNSAVAIDLLVVYNEELMKTLMKMKAKDYFESHMQVKRDYPDMVDIWHWELTPGQVVRDYPIQQRSDEPVGAVLFGDYLAKGDHRIRLAQQAHAHVRMKKFDFCVLEQGCSADPRHQAIVSRDAPEDPSAGAMAGNLSKGKDALKQGMSTAKQLKGEVSQLQKMLK